MTIDWSKLDTAAMKSARAAEQAAKQAEREAVAVLRTAAKADPTFDQIKALTPAQYQAWVDNALQTTPTPQRAVIKFLLQVAAVVLRD